MLLKQNFKYLWRAGIDYKFSINLDSILKLFHPPVIFAVELLKKGQNGTVGKKKKKNGKLFCPSVRGLPPDSAAIGSFDVLGQVVQEYSVHPEILK